jgi:MHS family citrate/tricarballylate:H+ symporter-like MFS transporter
MADVAARAGAPTIPPAAVSRRHVAGVVLGNALEFYDFLTYAFFAVQIGHTFFPGHSPFASLMLSLVTFGAGFICRPIGAVLIGRYADRVGRRPAMVFTFALMGASILGLALTPSFAAIGPLAPVLVVTWRLAQGFALGGEVGPTTAFLVEATPPLKRGFYSAWQSTSQAIASMAGGLVGVALAGMMGEAALEAWGWRVAFALGALVLPVGLLIRRDLPETLHHAEAPNAAHAARGDLHGHARVVIVGLALILAGTVTTYVQSFMTTYAITTLHMPTVVALGAPVAVGVSQVIFCLIGGALGDRIGRKPLLIWPRILLIVLIYPAFVLMVRNRDAVTLLTASALLAAVHAFCAVTVLVSITESLRKDIRSAGLATIYATSVAVFGGSTQPIVAWLIHATGDPMAPAWYMIGANVIGLIAALFVTETAPRLTGGAAPLRDAASLPAG